MRTRTSAPLLLLGLLAIVGCRATAPGLIESSVAAWTKKHITVKGTSDRSPLSAGAATLRDGKIAFEHYCFVCHGMDGQNTGVPFAATLDPPVPSLVSKEVQEYSDGQLKWIIENGISPSGMPASREILNDNEIWSIVVYIRHLPPAGSLGEPHVYTDQQEQER